MSEVSNMRSNGHDAAAVEEQELFPEVVDDIAVVDEQFRLLYSLDNGKYHLLPEVRQRHQEIRAFYEVAYLRQEIERLKMEVDCWRRKYYGVKWQLDAPKPKPEQPEKPQSGEFQQALAKLKGTLGH